MRIGFSEIKHKVVSQPLHIYNRVLGRTATTPPLSSTPTDSVSISGRPNSKGKWLGRAVLSLPVIGALFSSAAFTTAVLAFSTAVNNLLPFGDPVLLIAFGAPALLSSVLLTRSLFKAFKAQDNNVEPKITKADILLTSFHSGTSLIFSSAYIAFRVITTVSYAMSIIGSGAILGIPGLNLLLATAFLVAELHIFSHGFLFNLGMLESLKHVWNSPTDQDLEKYLNHVLHLLTKPTGRGADLIICTLPTLLLREGAVFQHIICKENKPVETFLREKFDDLYKIAAEAYREAGTQNLRDAYKTLGNAYIELGKAYYDPATKGGLWRGDFKDLDPNLGEGRFAENGNLFEKRLGELIQRKGEILGREGLELLYRAEKNECLSHEELKEKFRILLQKYGIFINSGQTLNGHPLQDSNLMFFERAKYRNCYPLNRSKSETLSRIYALLGLTVIVVERIDTQGNEYLEVIPWQRVRIRNERGEVSWKVLEETVFNTSRDRNGWSPERIESYSEDIAYIREDGSIVWKEGVDPAEAIKTVKNKDANNRILPKQVFCFDQPFARINTDGGVVDLRLTRQVVRLKRDAETPYLSCSYRIPVNLKFPWRKWLKKRKTDELFEINFMQAHFILRYKSKSDGRWYDIPWNPTFGKKLSYYDPGEGEYKDVPLKEIAGIEVRMDGETPSLWITLKDKNRTQLKVAFKNTESFPEQLRLILGDIAELSIDVGITPAGYLKKGARYCVEYRFKGKNEEGKEEIYSRFMLLKDLPPQFDPYSLDYESINQQINNPKGKDNPQKLKIRGYTYTAHRYPIEPHKIPLDFGTIEKPSFAFVQSGAREKFFKEHGLNDEKPEHVLGINQNGKISWHAIKESITKREYEKLIECQRMDAKRLGLILKEEELKISLEDSIRILEITNPEEARRLKRYLTWSSTAKVDEDHEGVFVEIKFLNPYNPNCSPELIKLYLDKKTARKIPPRAAIYNGAQEKFITRVESTSHTKDGKPYVYLKLTRVSKKTIASPIDIPEEAHLAFTRVKSSIQIAELDENGRETERKHWLPYDRDLCPNKVRVFLFFKKLGYQVYFDPKNPRWTSGIAWGRFETISTAKNFVPSSSKNIPAKFGNNEQGVFFGRVDNSSLSDDSKPPFLAKLNIKLSNGNFMGIEEAKNKPGEECTLMPGTSFVSRHDKRTMFLVLDPETRQPLLEELEYRIQTEDAKRSLSAFWNWGLYAGYSQLNDSIEEGTDPILAKLGTQRRRWMSPLGDWVRFRQLLFNEIVRARILRQYPARFTFYQLYQWFNVHTWYYDALAKYALMVMPAAYQLKGLSPLVSGGGITFPLLWSANYGSNTLSFFYAMHKAKISTPYAFCGLQGLYYMLMPYLAEGAFYIKDESSGEFIPSKEGKEVIPWKYLLPTVGAAVLNASILGSGILSTIDNINPHSQGLWANTVWPGINLILISIGLGMYKLSRLRATIPEFRERVLELTNGLSDSAKARYQIPICRAVNAKTNIPEAIRETANILPMIKKMAEEEGEDILISKKDMKKLNEKADELERVIGLTQKRKLPPQEREQFIKHKKREIISNRKKELDKLLIRGPKISRWLARNRRLAMWLLDIYEDK